MAYDTYLAERIRQYFTEQQLNFFEKKMMGGLVFMLNDKMCCGIHFDKKRNCDLLMARVGEEASQSLMSRPGCHPMEFTGRPMKGFVSIVCCSAIRGICWEVGTSSDTYFIACIC